MAVVLDPVGSSPLVEAYVRGLGPLGRSFVTRVHPSDEMFLYNLALQRGSIEAAAILYYSKGWQIYHTIREVARWRFGTLGAVPGILDFASGFGRATRFLTEEVPNDRIWVSEINPEAVAFRVATFGVSGLVSARDAKAFRPGRTFGMIVASSLFSHLPEEPFRTWMARLYNLLDPGGLLLFSVHGQTLLPQDSATGLEASCFGRRAKARASPSNEYGTTWVTDRFVRESIVRACGEGVLVSYRPFGLCGHQDLYIVVRDGQKGLPPIRVSRFPRGNLERFTFDDRGLQLAGIALGAADEMPPDVQLMCGTELAHRSIGTDRGEFLGTGRFRCPERGFRRMRSFESRPSARRAG